MYGTMLRRGISLAILGLLLVGVAVPVGAHETKGAIVGEATLRATPFATQTYGPGVVGGAARLVTTGTGEETIIVVRMAGLRPGTTHIGHIHFGDCTRLFPGAIIHNLEPLVANSDGVAVSKTVVADSMAGLVDCDWWVAVHEGPANSTPQSPAIAVGPVRFLADED